MGDINTFLKPKNGKRTLLEVILASKEAILASSGYSTPLVRVDHLFSPWLIRLPNYVFLDTYAL